MESWKNYSKMCFRRTMKKSPLKHHFLHCSLTILTQNTQEDFKSRFAFLIQFSFFPFHFNFPFLLVWKLQVLWCGQVYCGNMIIFIFGRQPFVFQLCLQRYMPHWGKYKEPLGLDMCLPHKDIWSDSHGFDPLKWCGHCSHPENRVFFPLT